MSAPRPILFRNATVLVSAADDLVLDGADVRIEGGRVAAVGVALPLQDAEIIDARGCILAPGLVNAHSHSYAALLKGTVSGEPLDLFVLEAMARRAPRPARFAYVAAAVHAAELLANGVTAVVDHFRHGALPAVEAVDAAMQAYADAGIRAVIAPMYEDRPYLDSLPIDRARLPAEIASRWRDVRLPPPEEYFELMTALVHRWRGHPTLGVMVGVDGPQRCTEALLARTGSFVAEHGVGFHTHLLEAKTQAVVGASGSEGLVARLDRHGLVGPRSSFAHFVWGDQKEIELLAARGASVVHNPLSNLLLGSGLAPIARMLRAGVCVALGTDSGSGARQSILEQARLAALLTRVTDPDADRWLSARETLAMATVNGARVMGLDPDAGVVRAGAPADLMLVDVNGVHHRPRGAPWAQLVMYESGANVRTVIVNGEVVVRDHVHTRLDLPRLLAEAEALVASDTQANAANLARVAAERPAMKALIDVALRAPLGIDRFAWPRERQQPE
jgi:cytosine/adenosine deaminase-related metal-dependent hydrolase